MGGESQPKKSDTFTQVSVEKTTCKYSQGSDNKTTHSQTEQGFKISNVRPRQGITKETETSTGKVPDACAGLTATFSDRSLRDNTEGS